MHYNRFYLVATVALSMLLPLLDLNWFTIDTPQSKQVQEVIEFVNKPMQSPKQLVEWDLVLFLGLIFISVILLSNVIVGKI